jgi:tetratricopeptide (TPR) repeat protein
LRQVFDIKDGRELGALAILILVATGIVCSLSRGGVLAMAVATVAVLGMMARTWSGLRITTFVVGIGLLGAGLVIWTGLTDRVGSRWELVSSESLSKDARLANWSDALRAARDFPVTGTGFGTYRYAYLPYQNWPATVHFYNADNQFVEGVVEGGLVGLGLILLSIGLSLAASLALARAVPADPVAIVGLFTVISQCVSASFDFGPSLSANMLAFALIIGAVTGRAAWQCGTGSVGRWLALPVLRPAWMTALVGVALLAHGVLGLGQISAAAASRTVRREIPRLDSAKSMSESSLADAIRRLQTVVTRQPDDAEAHRALAELWIYRYRLQTLEALAVQTPVSGVPADWSLTDPAVLYLRIQDWIRAGNRERVDALSNIPQVRDNLVPAWRHLAAAQAACPLMPEIDLHLATLAFAKNSHVPTGEAHLRRAVLVSPGNPDLLVRCGTLANAAGLTEFAYACWHRSLELAPDRLPKIRHLWRNQVTLDQELRWILPDSTELLLSLAGGSYASDEHRAIRHALVLRAQQLLEGKSDQLTESGRLRALARCSVLRDDPAAAVEYYRQVLGREPLNIGWRLELVELLQQQGKYQAALDQAELCQAMAPNQAAIRERVTSLRQLQLRQSPATPEPAAPRRTP